MPRLNLPKPFLTLQLDFARRMSALSRASLEESLIDCTNIRILLSIHVNQKTKTDVPEWRTFMDGLISSDDPDQWTYEYYQETERNELKLTEGSCFWYSYPFRDQPKVRLHFSGRDRSGHGALSRERIDARRQELIELLTTIRSKHPDAETVRGGSWLYNIEPYCRLFPPAYIESATPVGYELQFWALWGQFLKGGFRINEEAVDTFRKAFAQADSVEACKQSFPYQVLRPECGIDEFYEHYGIE